MVLFAAKSYFTPLNLIRKNVCRLHMFQNSSGKPELVAHIRKMSLSTSCIMFSASSWRSRISSYAIKPKDTNIISYHRWKRRSGVIVRGFADVPANYNVYRERDIDEERYALEYPEVDLEDAENSSFSSDGTYISDFNKLAPVGEEVILKLETTFGMSREEAFKVVRSPKFFLVADAAILDIINCMADFNIPAARIQRSPWLLLQTADDFTERMNMVADNYLFHDYYDGLGFCFFGKYKIRHYQNLFEKESKDFPNHRNRIYCMAEILMVPVDHLTDEIVKVHRLLTMSFYRIEAYSNLLNKYNIQREDILSDLWVFFNNMDLAEKRLQRIINAGCKRPKLWMCRCPEEVFEKTVSKYQNEKDALGDCHTLEEYLIKRLGCTKEELAGQLEFNNSLRTVSIAKIQRIIDLLLSEGFSTFQILHSLRILKYSEVRTAERIKRLKDMGISSISINTLYKSNLNFENYCDSFNDIGFRKSPE